MLYYGYFSSLTVANLIDELNSLTKSSNKNKIIIIILIYYCDIYAIQVEKSKT